MGLSGLAIRARSFLLHWVAVFRSRIDTATLALLSVPWTWRLRHVSRRVRLRADTAGYQTRTGITRTGESFSVLARLLRGSGMSAAVALIVTVTLEAIAYLTRSLGAANRLVVTVPSSDYEPMLLAVAGFGATILGLYFTALSVVISTTYAEAPSSVRELVAQDQAGTSFARLVAGLVVVSVSLVTAGLFGFDASRFTLTLVGALTALSILALLSLSVRTFSFFDPVRLSPPLLQAFGRWTDRATAGGLRWRVPEFQDAYRARAQDVLTTFRDLIGFTAEVERADITDLRSIGQRILVMWAQYSADKTSVPIDSRWFERTYEHPDWFTESATSLHVALATDVGLAARAREYGDSAWAERQMADAVSACLSELLEGEHRAAVGELVGTASQLAQELGRRIQISEAKLLCKAVSVARADPHEPEADTGEAQILRGQAEALAVVDVFCLLPINLLLGFVDRCSSLDASSFTDGVDAALTRSEGPFSADLPIDVVTQLDQLKSGLDFERDVEDRQVTPDWWLHHVAARHTISVMYDALVDIVGLIESEIVTQAEGLAYPERAFEAAVVAGRGLEASNKLSTHLPAIQSTLDELASLRVVDDEFWPDVELPSLAKRAEDMHKRSVDVFAEVAPVLGVFDRDETLPDLFGQGHALLVRETFLAILNGDADRFGELWPKVFTSGLLAYERIRRDLADHHDRETATIYMSELLADLFELSGYALARSELDDRAYWGICQERWDQLFEGADDTHAMAEMMMMFMRLRKSTFAILPRATIRANREQRFRSLLAERGLVGDDLLDFDLDIDHPSPIIRAIARGTLGMNDAATLFVAEYLSELPGAGDPPHDAKSLKDVIAHERSRGDVK